MPRLNGFQKPCNAFQISSYVLFGLCIGWFYVFVIPAVPNIFVVITFSAIFLANSLAVFVFTFLATKADLADINLKTRGFPLPRPEFDLSSDALDSRRMALNNNVYSWCTFCEWEVFRDSKHCRTCDRCVNKFDHHCRWINNCVAKGNYRFFIVSVASTNLLLLISLVLSVFALVYSFSGKAWELYYLPKNLHIVFLAGNALFTAGILMFLGYLLVFHIWLFFRGITTYDYIIRKDSS